jgi:glycosidase
MKTEFVPVDWIANSNIYEVNLRQYTQEGTINAFKKHLPRLKDMGIDILWFMPLTPISRKNRKGSLGSYYACSSYTEINPEYGTKNNFLTLVDEAHQLGFKVIVDWVANHTGCDHEWTTSHGDFYKKNEQGDFFDEHGWDDVIDLDYSNHSMRIAMIMAMRYWINNFNIDGFRCDMAMLTPVDFWIQARLDLTETKDLFWLAELDPLDNPEYMMAFDSAYTWRWMNAAKQCKEEGAQHIHHLKYVLSQYQATLPVTACPAWFTSNHDENSWNGTEYEKYGEMALPLAFFSATWRGLPLIYSGQELPNHKRLAFFDKDCLDWKPKPDLHEFYKKILELRKRNLAFSASPHPENCILLNNSVDHHVLSFMRKNGDSTSVVVINFSQYHLSHVEVSIKDTNGLFTDLFTNVTKDFGGTHIYVDLPPWSFQAWIK